VKELSGRAIGEGVDNTSETAPRTYENNVQDILPPRLEAEPVNHHEEATTSTSASESAACLEKDFGTLVIFEQGGSRYVNHNFWARVTEEVCWRLLCSVCNPLTLD
jgi:hypothetical protein